MLDAEVLRRYRRVVPINGAQGEWNRQDHYGANHFYPRRGMLTDAMLGAMLTHEYWLGSRAPADGRTDRIAFDIDCKAPDQVGARDEAYEAIRGLFGVERVPLVYSTPSGLGLRVVYRIPEVPLTDLIAGSRRGLVADVLRGAGLDPRSGSIEIFPQARHSDRLPLGRRMPILDPSSLVPLSHAAIGDTFDLDLLVQALEEMEAWHAAPHLDLLEHLRALPKGAAGHLAGEPGSSRSWDGILVRGSNGTLSVSPEAREWVKTGLRAPGTRNSVEWFVGLAFAADPGAFPQYGLGGPPTERHLAGALARWLSENHNGHSQEWDRSLGRTRSVQGAIKYWMDRYLSLDANGTNLIRRVRRAVQGAAPETRRVRQLSDKERKRLFRIAKKALPAGSGRYHFECWMFGWQRQIKEILYYHARRGNPHTQYGKKRRKDVYIEVAAEWMEELPFGSGKSTETGESRYLIYKRILSDKGLFVEAAPYQSPTFRNPEVPRDVRGTATRYRTPYPDMEVCAGNLPIAPWELKPAIAHLRTNGRELSIDEAYHALWVTEQGVDLGKRYGRRTADRIRRYVSEIRSARSQP